MGWLAKSIPSMPNQALHMTGAAILVSRDTTLLQRPRQVSFIVGPLGGDYGGHS